ncbi:Nn.00g071990.m01.CDS01 [Neocucurbitaria sp. VM-36]
MAPYTGPGISVHVNITVAPENVSKFLELFKPCYEAVTAEPECVFFEVYHNPAAPGQFRFVENWNASAEWFKDVQLQKDYYKPYVANTEPLWITPRVVEVYDRMPGSEWLTLKKEFTEASTR